MRKLTTAVLAGAAAIAVSTLVGGSAQAGPATTSRLAPADVVVWHGNPLQDEMGGCRSHRKGGEEMPQSTLP
ncbi:MAG TPA: hypothetical protein VFV67_02400 [Actinophytocola sp.]|uniref:hypothetical protein n=1 Tax=Actinophytocola sp. TaxID=1872138 RepID=UPI002DBF2CBE|nr:hypothetical protein [Actinophytocola sp.]HEU5469477.1 hypothetical protein [Actinophytocola sp.]